MALIFVIILMQILNLQNIELRTSAHLFLGFFLHPPSSAYPFAWACVCVYYILDSYMLVHILARVFIVEEVKFSKTVHKRRRLPAISPPFARAHRIIIIINVCVPCVVNMGYATRLFSAFKECAQCWFIGKSLMG